MLLPVPAALLPPASSQSCGPAARHGLLGPCCGRALEADVSLKCCFQFPGQLRAGEAAGMGQRADVHPRRIPSLQLRVAGALQQV